jgi:hypothetical protein
VCVCVCLCVGKAGQSVEGQLIVSRMDESCNIANHSVQIIVTAALILLIQHAPIGSKEYAIKHRCTLKCLVDLCVRFENNIEI